MRNTSFQNFPKKQKGVRKMLFGLLYTKSEYNALDYQLECVRYELSEARKRNKRLHKSRLDLIEKIHELLNSKDDSDGRIRQIYNGVLYDTSNATLIGEYDFTPDEVDVRRYVLFSKTKVYQGNSNKIFFMENCGLIVPMTEDEARNIIGKFDADAYLKLFEGAIMA